MPSLLQAFNGIDHDRPVVFFCYTIKGHGLPLAGHKDNHSGLMNPDQMETLRAEMQVPQGQEWDKFAGLALAPAELQRFLDAVPFNALGARRYRAPVIAVPDVLAVEAPKTASTQQGFGGLLNEIARNDTALASRIVTTSPDVTVSTNLGPWVNRCGLFARHSLADTFRSERIASAQKWEASPQGQHIELGIAEMNLFLNLAALGLSHSLFGERLLPVGTLYDPFPADYCERNWLRDETGGSVYLRLSTRQLEQPARAMTPALRQGIIDGAYWLREPGPNCEVVIAYTGAVAPEAIDAVGLMAEDRRDIGLLAITSADRLEAGWHAAERARQRGNTAARSHIERLLAPLAGDCGIVTVLDGHPATLAWLGGVHGHRVKALGVEHFGQTGTIQDLYRHHGLDTRSIISAAQAIAPQRTMRRYVALG
jgi:pyruvate dehydrogenase E1 component